MKKHSILILISLCLTLAFCGQQPTADMILVNGKVFTADPSQPNAEAVYKSDPA